MKEIKGYENYKIDEDGNVFNLKEHKLFQWTDKCGFRQVVLYKDNKRKYKRVNRLVYETYCGKIPPNMVLLARDGDTSNTSLNNLRLVTISEKLNTFYKRNTSTRYNIKVYTKDTKDFLGDFTSIREMCRTLKLNRRAVSNIIKYNKENNYNYNFVITKCNHT